MDNHSAIKRLESLTKIHTESFNFAISQGLHYINFEFLSEMIKDKKDWKRENFFITNFYICKPYFYGNSHRQLVIPRQCRETRKTYKGDLIVSIIFKNFKKSRFILKNGEIPIMIKSHRCNLFGMKPKQLIEIEEEEVEVGGYFILNGMEKILRLIVVPRRNTIQLISRISNTQRGELCSVFSASFRSVDRNQNSKTIHLHYLTSGTIDFRIIINKQEFFIPVIILLRSIENLSDVQLFKKLAALNITDKSFCKRIMTMIKDSYSKCSSGTQKKNLSFLGKIFRFSFPEMKESDLFIGKYVISKYIFIHLGKRNKKKSELLCFMIHKLLMLQKGHCLEDNPDAFDTQEFLLPGNLILINLKEQLNNVKTYFKSVLRIGLKKENGENYPKKFLKEVGNSLSWVTHGLEKMISIGSFLGRNENELSQTTGLSVNIERINFGRFFSYFRSVHRGKYFSEIKSVSGRKIFLESWGFLCPVHSPDGSPCGILNHLSASVVSNINNPIDKTRFIKFLSRFGKRFILNFAIKNSAPIILDGEIVGHASENFLYWFTDMLRSEKVSSNGFLSFDSEIIYNRRDGMNIGPNYICVNSQEARPLRPIKWNKYSGCIKIMSFEKRNRYNFPVTEFILEMITSMEQCLLKIEDYKKSNIKYYKKNFNTHEEIDPVNILSITAGITPFSDLNQSPRNVYQCQMFKQSLGTPFYTFWRRNDAKTYFLITPQVPVCRGRVFQDGLNLDAFPNGFNVVLSVLSYTGYDMEDAMIINKSSIERGLSSINTSNTSVLETDFKKNNTINKYKSHKNRLDTDGLIKVQNVVKKGDPVIFIKKFKKEGIDKEFSICFSGTEDSVVDQLKLNKIYSKKKQNEEILLKIRSRRKPSIGDKFASRHGQKGVFSSKFSQNNMPFSEIGITPDIIFNPHGFPSRMTIGLIIEIIAGKAGVLGGKFQDSTPFRFYKNRISAYEFGENLRNYGFQFFGNEVLYSGFSGEPFSVNIFTGIVHYQRLKHMTLDKFQVSEVGPRNFLTRQPTKGKKSGGAIRLGEMERDALLGHGCSFLLNERIQNSSDLHNMIFESKTGNFLQIKSKESEKKSHSNRHILPRKILLPYVSKYLAIELACLNIKLNFGNFYK